MASRSVSQWAPYAQRASRATGIPASVLLGLTQIESGGNRWARSPTGAQWLTQFEPATARQYGVTGGSVDSQFMGAARYLKNLGYAQNPAKALASYNAGPGNWQAGTGYAKNVLAASKAYGAVPSGAPAGGVMGATGTATTTTTDPAQPPVDTSATDLLTALQGERDQQIAVRHLYGQYPQAPAFSAHPAFASEAGQLSGSPRPLPPPDIGSALASIQPPPDTSTAGSTTSSTTVSGAVPGGMPAAPVGKGRVTFAAGAIRPGTKVTPQLVGVLNRFSGVAGPITVGTATNHSKYTVDGNVSDHYSGNAADLPYSGQTLTQRFAQALLTFGNGETIQFLGNRGTRNVRITPQTAMALAREGGIANIRYAGGRLQAIGNTRQGGDHYNHLHLGYGH